MGIKDWFGGSKKKDALREKVKEAVSTGRLSDSKAAELEQLRQELEVDDVAADRTVIRRAMFNEAVEAVKAGGKLGPKESAELAKIQKFLALRNDQIERTRGDLARFRVLLEIRDGKLPTVPPNTATLRGIKLEAEEIAHYVVPVDALEAGSVDRALGCPLPWGGDYEPEAAAVHALPCEGAKPLGTGHLVITNRRLLFKAEARAAAVRLAPETRMFIYSDGLRLERTAVGNTLFRFATQSEETCETVGALLAALNR